MTVESRRRAAPFSPRPRVWQFCYLLIAAFVAAAFVLTVYAGDNINASLKLIFLAVMVLTLKRWTGALLLGMIQVQLFYLETPSAGSGPELTNVLWVLLTVTLLMAVSRYRTLQDLDQRPVLPALRRFLRTVSAGESTDTETSVSGNVRAVLMNCVRTLLVATACAAMAIVLMRLVPLTDMREFNPIREFRLKPTGYRTLMSGLLLFLLWLPVWLVVNEVMWRKLLPSQADVYLRSVFLKWIHRDLRMTVLKRVKMRRAEVRGIRPVEPAADAGSTKKG
ncbi:MAG: hypothetical protein RIK87_10450 [Fuerstiella sp.]